MMVSRFVPRRSLVWLPSQVVPFSGPEGAERFGEVLPGPAGERAARRRWLGAVERSSPKLALPGVRKLQW